MPDDDLDQMDGGALRKKLEDSLKVNRELAESLAGLKTEKILRDKGYTLVKPEDLKGVSLDKIESEAERIYNDRRELRAGIAKDLLRRQGVKDDELDQAVEDFLSGTAPALKTETDEAAERLEAVRGLGQMSGIPVSQTPASQLSGRAAIEHGLMQAAKRQRS